MAKRCDLTGVGSQSGHQVSHSNRKTKRRFLPNLHKVSLKSDVLGREFSFRITAATLRSVDHNGGLDDFLLTATNSNLTNEAQKLKREIKKAQGPVEKTAKAPKAPKEPKAKKPAAKKAPAKKSKKAE